MNKRKLFVLPAIVAMALGATGCSSSQSKSNVLTVGINAAMNGVMSPLYYESLYDGYAIDLIYQSMLKYDVDQQLVPELATDLPQVSDDGLTYTFKLREGIKFSDGTDFDAKDVKYTFTVLADPSYTGRFSDYVRNIVGYEEYNEGDAKELAGIETPDDYTVVFHLKEPRIDAQSMIGTMCICSDEQFDYVKGDTTEIETNTDKPIGTGAYVLNSFDKATGASFSRNEEFDAEKGKFKIDNVIIKHTDISTEIDELTSGTVDYLPAITDPQKIVSASQAENLTYDTAPGNSQGYFFFNCAQGSTSEKAVRQALVYATDRQSFVDSYFSYSDDASDEIRKEKLAYVPAVYANPLSGDLGDVIRGEATLDGLNTYEFDLDKAGQILDEAGWLMGDDGYRYKDGNRLVVRIMIAEGSSSMDTLIPIINRDWKTLGVDLKQNVIDFNTLLSTVGNEEELDNWETSVLAFAFSDLENTQMNTYLKTGDANNYARLSNETLDETLDEAMYTSDKEASTKAYEEAMIMENDEAAYIPLYASNNFNLYNKRIKGMKTSSFYDWSDAIEDAYLE